MKKICLLLLCLVLLPSICLGQAKIYTKKVRLSDFPTKTTKIVLTGNDLLDSPLGQCDLIDGASEICARLDRMLVQEIWPAVSDRKKRLQAKEQFRPLKQTKARI